jgi:hypothetical protein
MNFKGWLERRFAENPALWPLLVGSYVLITVQRQWCEGGLLNRVYAAFMFPIAFGLLSYGINIVVQRFTAHRLVNRTTDARTSWK